MGVFSKKQSESSQLERASCPLARFLTKFMGHGLCKCGWNGGFNSCQVSFVQFYSLVNTQILPIYIYIFSLH